ncbi:MAG: hypothetical protein ACC742_03960 [Thermoanaerobaculales bacterium]
MTVTQSDQAINEVLQTNDVKYNMDQSFSRENTFEIEDVAYTLRSNNGYDLYVRSVRPKLALYPDDRFPAVLELAGGWGEMTFLLNSETIREAASNGVIFVAFDSPTRTDYPVGSSERDYKGFKDQDDVAEVLNDIFNNPNVSSTMVGVWTRSSGALLASGVLGRYPGLSKNVAFFIDVEGPHCAKELLDDPELDIENIGGLQNWKKARDAKVGEGRDYETEDDFWFERCGYSFVGNYEGIYQRLQGKNDHALEYYYKHAVAYLNAATNGKSKWARLNSREKSVIYRSEEEPGGIDIGSVLEIESLYGNDSKAWNLFYDILEEIREEQADNDGGSPFGFHPAGVFKPGYPNNGFVDAENIGVRWHRPPIYAFWSVVQPDTGDATLDFSLYDHQYSAVPQGIGILANIAPDNPRFPQGYTLTDSYIPVDIDKYKTFVRATVERYDGDGIDDMPGLTNPIKHWQVGNEPSELAASDFAIVQQITYEAIKAACPDCTVLIGGVAGLGMIGGDDYVTNFESIFAPILAALGGQYVDVFDFHWYGNATGDYRLRNPAGGQDVLTHIRATLAEAGFPDDLPIWITEMGAYSGDPVSMPFPPFTDLPFQTERQQAGDLLKRYVYSLSRGVETIFSAFLIEGFQHDDGYFDHTGVIYDGQDSNDLGLGVKKLGYYAYKKMTEKLEGADWDTLATLHDGTEDDHLYLFRVEKAGQPVYVAWWDYFDEPGYTSGDAVALTLTSLTGTTVTVTDLVPDYPDGSQVTDYASAFTVSRVPVADAEAVVELGQDPVIIELTCRSHAPRRASGRVVP